MPLTNLSEPQALIVSIIEDAGGEASHEAIAAALDELGRPDALSFVSGLVAESVITAVVRARFGARAQLIYGLPPKQESPPATPSEANPNREENT